MKTNKTIHFTYPRELSFYHEEFQVGCGETEKPFIGFNGKTFLYVWHKIKKIYFYYLRWHLTLEVQKEIL